MLRVSASARRAAAAYGNAFWLLSEARTLISLLLFVLYRLSSRLTWHDFAYVTMVQKVRSGSVAFTCFTKVTYSNGLGPYIPVTPDPESQPRAKAADRDGP